MKLALREKGLDFKRKIVGPDDFDSPELSNANPRGEVPALVDDGTAVFDSTVMCEYLEDKYPEPRLYPAEPAERARVRMLEDIADTQHEAALWALFEIRFFGRGTGELGEAITARALEAVARMYDRLEAELDGRQYFTGDSFGVGDCAVMPHVSAASMSGAKADEDHPRVRDWVKRTRERESVQQDRADVGAAMATMAADAEAAAKRPRQYRDHRLEWMMRNGGEKIVADGVANGSIKFSRDL